MATNTTNYNLVKPSENEYYDINVSNSNLDIIDTEIKKINDRLDSVSTDAQSTSFDNSSNGMEATNVQDAIEENKTSILNNKTNISNLTTKVNNGQNFKLTTDEGSYIKILPSASEDERSLDNKLSGWYDILNCTGTLPSDLNSTNNNVFLEVKRRTNDYCIQYLYDVRSTRSWIRKRYQGTWYDWEKNHEFAENEISLLNGFVKCYSEDSPHIFKRGNIATINLSIKNPSTVADQTIICNLPSAYIPKTYTRLSANTHDTSYSYSIDISTSGVVCIRSTKYSANTELRLNASWLIK